ncbi:MAG: DUF6090 family protein [Flavobacteriales bacterium]
MLSVLRKRRKKLIEAGSLGEYLKYAFGEIILVVIGILIALSINNWNVERVKSKRLDNIAVQVINDLEADTAEIKLILDALDPIEDTYFQIMEDSLSLEDLKECDYCSRLVSVLIPFTPNESGYNLLKNLESDILDKRDSLILTTKQFYGQALPMLQLLDQSIQEDIKGNLTHWKEEEDWFADWILGDSDERFYQYMKTQDYRNRVANFYLLQYNNNLVVLDAYSKQAKALANAWRKELGLELKE